jgi:hypothetical protein
MIRPGLRLSGKDREAHMTIVCSSCQRYLGTQPPFHDKAVTHGLCTPCEIRQQHELQVVVLTKERADSFPVLNGLLRRKSELRVVIDRRQTERRRAWLEVAACRRGTEPDRRRTRSLRLV